MRKIIYSALCILALTACGNTRREHSEIKQISNMNNYLIDSDAFDLATVVSAFTDGKYKKIEDLEAFANKSGINNVDTDRDGNVDKISITEKGRGEFEFTAKGSSSGREIVIASANITKEENKVRISAGYTDYVNGHSGNYYHFERQHSELLEAVALMHILSPSRPIFMGGTYMPMGYAPRPVMSQSQATMTRRTIRKTSKLKPASKTNVQPKKLAKRLKKNPKAKNLSSRAGSRDYSKRDKNKKKNQATSVLGKNRNKQKQKKYSPPKPRRQKPPRRPRPPRRRRR